MIQHVRSGMIHRSHLRRIAAAVFLCGLLSGPVQSAEFPALVAENRVARLLWFDHSSDTLMWGEVRAGDKWTVTASPVRGFPELQPETQDLVQMKHAQGLLLVSVRDHQEGRHKSGWVALDMGVREVPHGNHSDWQYVASPTVRASQLNATQGNPADLSVQDGVFYLAHDARNGFTSFRAEDLRTQPAESCGMFRNGGGGQISLAVVNNTACYATWSDADGANAGRVDVVRLTTDAQKSLDVSFRLPSGAIHGTAANSGRVFFAPTDGICWVDANGPAGQSAQPVRVNHLSLGKEAESEKPLRTEALVNHRNWVLFTAGSGENAALCLLDAKAARPEIVRVNIPVADGRSLTTPEVVLAAGGKRYAFVFQDHHAGDSQGQLTILDLDPNGDRDLRDARVAKVMPVGASGIDGHSGRQTVCFDSEGRHACLTNPGDGTIWVMTLRDLQIRAKSIVGGMPGTIVAIGAPSHHH
jgi:hypothetical protein